MKGERYGVPAPLIGPCAGECGVPERGRIKPCYPVGSDVWLCHACIQARQAETATRLRNEQEGEQDTPARQLVDTQVRAVADGGPKQ